MKKYNKEILTNVTITYKIDGVKGIFSDNKWLSKSGKELYNLPNMEKGEYEIFLGDWSKSISACRTMDGKSIDKQFLYRLDILDNRLYVGNSDRLCNNNIESLLKKALSCGYEGLVLYAKEGIFKVKPTITYDIPIMGIIEGKNRNKGRLGSFITPMGKVGSGLSDKDRVDFFKIELGTIIEVKCMELTKNNKFRHPRFIRVRWDK